MVVEFAPHRKEVLVPGSLNIQIPYSTSVKSCVLTSKHVFAGQYKNNLDSLDESGQSKPHKLDSEAGQPVQHLKRKWKQKLMPQDKRVIPGRASKKRGGGNTKMLAGKLRAKRLRKNMTESEVRNIV